MAKKGFFSFIAGATLGGLVTMLSAKRSGSDIRKELQAAWKKGNAGLDVLGKEAKDLALEAKDALAEFYNSPMVQKQVKSLSSQAKASLQTHFDQTMETLSDVKNMTTKKIKEAQKSFEKKLDEAFNKDDDEA